MSTHELFQKHFGNVASVDMKHPNIESLFEELNAECLQEDKHKNCNIPCVSQQRELLFAFGKYLQKRNISDFTPQMFIDDFLSEQ